ncbi:Armadillo-type fold [Pseudocohnilembus persalinus]|uniref:Armadillo-type fold n=1 Tax=Pseudocohnilembus persalinus TaxID=266149 RepID=A0A0V0R192_PSEPJ|nr:Armadillo-type fold [Pseudocohnilembus persalinus]|eukprot:KRX08284.1 Armadillo-type fold [Pseudocohnilembus persalinus]
MKKENKTGIPINQLIDEIKTEDVRKRINSVKNLDVIASALGPERTRAELVPFLNDDEDTVLLQLCKSLDNFSTYIGGKSHIQSLFPILEWLCKCDESIVREKASHILKKYICQMDIKKHEDSLIQLIKRLYESPYSFSKGPATYLIPGLYLQVSRENQNLLFSYYLKTCKDEKSSVRKQASQNFKDYVLLFPQMKDESMVEQLNSIFNQFLKDDQDLCRLYLVDALVAYAQSNLLNLTRPNFLTFLNKLSEDSSWRIKYYLCDKMGELIKGIGKDLFKQHLMSIYLKYLQDPEPELRSISAARIDVTCSSFDVDDIVKHLIPQIKVLAKDSQSYVRQSLAGSFLSISSVIGKKQTSEHVLPIFLELLKDEDSEVLGVDTLSHSILPALTELAQDKNWRIRHSSIDIIGFFAKEIGSEFLNDKIIQILMEWIKDPVFSVREQALIAVKNLAIYLGSTWLEKNVMPKILVQQNVPNYLHRITILLLVTQIAEHLNQAYLSKTIYPVLLNLAKDPVPNVRMNVSKTFKTTAKYFKDKVNTINIQIISEQTHFKQINQDTIRGLLQNMCDDSDFDVRFNSKDALDSL